MSLPWYYLSKKPVQLLQYNPHVALILCVNMKAVIHLPESSLEDINETKLTPCQRPLHPLSTNIEVEMLWPCHY